MRTRKKESYIASYPKEKTKEQKEEELFELEQQLNIPHKDRYYKTKKD